MLRHAVGQVVSLSTPAMGASVDSSPRLPPAANGTASGAFSPTRRPRTSLATRLSLPTNLAVVGTMAVFTGVQLTADLRVEGAARHASLAQSLAPLIADLERGQSQGEAGEAVARFHQALLRQGRPRHVIDVVAADGRSFAKAGDLALERVRCGWRCVRSSDSFPGDAPACRAPGGRPRTVQGIIGRSAQAHARQPVARNQSAVEAGTVTGRAIDSMPTR